MRIQILMSTYNGGQYIRTQLDSIINQSIENKSLLIRDDGSTDDTLDIIRDYQKVYPWIILREGENIGVQRSFFELIALADTTADFVAFADQDDQWLPEKLQVATGCLKAFSDKKPLLYCSDKLIVGKNLEEIHVTVSRVVKKITFGNALVQNICTGCTAVINRTLLLLLQQHIPKNPDVIIMHDWWLYLTASCFGDVYYDKRAFIRYRQHGNNTSGAMMNKHLLLKYRLNQLFQPRGELYLQIEEFQHDFCGELALSNYKQEYGLINKLLYSKENLKGRFLVFIDKRYFRQKLMDDIIFRGIVLIGKL